MADPIDKLLGELLAKNEPPQTLDVASTQGRIARAALALFAERSYEAATTKAIAERAEVTERTLFKHFPSKEQLFAQTVYPALLRILQPLTIEVLKRLLAAHQGDFKATLRAIVTERVRFALDHPTLLAMVARELLLRPGFRAAFMAFFEAQFLPQIEAFLAAAKANGQLRDLPTDLVLRALVGQIFAYITLRTLLPPGTPRDEERDIEQIVEVLLTGLGG